MRQLDDLGKLLKAALLAAGTLARQDALVEGQERGRGVEQEEEHGRSGGTDAQHAVFQLLHQGTHLVPVDFIAAIQPGDDLDPAHHRNLLANCFAQGAALMAGKASKDGARAYPGDRPSATILCDELNPATLGALIAFHEHRTFANGVLMEINSFDQFGVELGKEIAREIVAGGATFDASTEALLVEAGIR